MPGPHLVSLLQQSAGTDPHPLSDLIGGTGNDWDEPPNDKASTALKRICRTHFRGPTEGEPPIVTPLSWTVTP